MNISTHTLTWSVTRTYICYTIDTVISTHTLTWSVTDVMKFKLVGYDISTHTLTWSVTFITTNGTICTDNFNSHAHVERDFVDIRAYKRPFISTHTLTWSVTH